MKATSSNESYYPNYQEVDLDKCRSLRCQLFEWHRELYQDPEIGGLQLEDYFDKHLSLVGPLGFGVFSNFRDGEHLM